MSTDQTTDSCSLRQALDAYYRHLEHANRLQTLALYKRILEQLALILGVDTNLAAITPVALSDALDTLLQRELADATKAKYKRCIAHSSIGVSGIDSWTSRQSSIP